MSLSAKYGAGRLRHWWGLMYFAALAVPLVNGALNGCDGSLEFADLGPRSLMTRNEPGVWAAASPAPTVLRNASAHMIPEAGVVSDWIVKGTASSVRGGMHRARLTCAAAKPFAKIRRRFSNFW